MPNETKLPPYDHKKREFRPSREELPKIQKLIFSSASEMLASNDDLRKSITFLTPEVKLVVKTFPSESFNRIEQLKSLDENLETLQFRAGLHQLRPFFDDELEIFNLEDLLHEG